MDDMRAEESNARFPRELQEWAGHHSGGVKRLFDRRSGRPGKVLLKTSLITRLELWVDQVVSNTLNTPRILLLVGGPGNGKTEAIEHTIYCMDHKLGANGKLVETLSRSFLPSSGKTVPRVVSVNAGSLGAQQRSLDLSIVQDATANAGFEAWTAPELLIQELLKLNESPTSCYYLCCVNRGVLDDALIYAIDNDLQTARALLEAITSAVSLSAAAPSCWPLQGFPEIAIWPMDVESLLISPEDGVLAPASILLQHATDSELWPKPKQCVAGKNCPYCFSQSLLKKTEHREAVLKILRWYELASGKRWSFRDLFSLVSYLLAGNPPNTKEQHLAPCEWAKHIDELDKTGQLLTKPRRQHLTAIFQLATSSYQHALFHQWDSSAANSLRLDINELKLDKSTSETRTLLGLQHFLTDRKTPYLPATIASLLENLADLLDPALASPDIEITINHERVFLGEFDSRFSRSLTGGLEFLTTSRLLSATERELITRLAKSDNMLSSASIRRRSPAAASRIQNILRDFSCRMARRSICTLSAIVSDTENLKAFQQVVEDDKRGQRLHEVARKVRNLLNTKNGFEVSLTTTFGQPLPPPQRQATLVVEARPVKTLSILEVGRPRSPLCFLEVGSGRSKQAIPLTYELFKAVKELERGLSVASLPRTVIALLDTTRARLAGPIVRDREILVDLDAKIRIGIDGTEVGSTLDGGFIAYNTGIQE